MLRLVLLLICFTSATAFAQGGPPLVTDDPGTPGDGKWEINTALQYQISPLTTVSETPILDANYGWGDFIQLNFVAGLNNTLDRVAGSTAKGFGAVSTAMKWRYFENASGLALSMYPRIDFHTPLTSKNEDVVDPGTRYFLPLELSQEIGKFGINPEIGYAYSTREPAEWDFGLATSYEFEKDREALFEIHYRRQVGFSRPEAIYNFGARYAFREWVSAIGAIGHSFSTFANEPPFWLVYLGAQFRF